MSTVRIFHLECPSPQDLLDGRAEGPVLRALAPLIGHRLHGETILSRVRFLEAVRHLGELPRFEDPDKNLPIVLHISAHGFDGGIAMGADELNWVSLVADLEPFVSMTGYPGRRIVVLSACFASKQTISGALTRSNNSRRVPLDYLFCTEDAVAWDHAAVAWAVFYHLLPDANLNKRSSIQGILDKVHAMGTTVHYWRWDAKKSKYLHYAPG